MMNADSLISDKVICSGIVRPDLIGIELAACGDETQGLTYEAAKGCGDVKEGLVEG